MQDRRKQSLEIRHTAAQLAATRPHPTHRSNGDEQRQRFEDGRPSYAGNFTKCLPHDDDGFLIDPNDYEAWVRSIDSGDPRDMKSLRIGPGPFQANGDLQYVDSPDPLNPISEPKLNWKASYTKPPKLRAWESQGAGSTFDLEGPDAQSLALPPCPSLDSQELIGEMGELYWMALCRDVPFADWPTDPLIGAASNSLRSLWWFRRDRTLQLNGATDLLPTSLARRRILSEDGTQPVPAAKLFRGVTHGEQVGPYVSQFLLIGNTGLTGAQQISDGMIEYGSMRADQRVRHAMPKQDYLVDWKEWLDVQNGANLRHRETYATPAYRFIATPRDLATYVHYDALYQGLSECVPDPAGTGYAVRSGPAVSAGGLQRQADRVRPIRPAAHPDVGDRSRHPRAEGGALSEVQRASPAAAGSGRRLDVPAPQGQRAGGAAAGVVAGDGGRVLGKLRYWRPARRGQRARTTGCFRWRSPKARRCTRPTVPAMRRWPALV